VATGWLGPMRSKILMGGLSILLFFALALGSSQLARGQSNPVASATIRVTGQVEHRLVLSDAQLQTLPRRRLVVTDEKGAPATYDGVPVFEILRRAGVPLGAQLRGPKMRLYVVVEASDGYAAVFALPELDPDFTARVVLLADRHDGHIIPSPEGPFRLVIPDEKRHARWVREVIALDVQEAK